MEEQKIYFNNAASTFPKAPGVEKAMCDTLMNIPRHPGRSGGFADDPLSDCRRLIADMLGVQDEKRIILSTSSTYALNLAIWGFPFKKGDHVVTSAAEHNSVLRPLHHAARRHSFSVHIIPSDEKGRIITSQFYKIVNETSPVLVALNHGSNVTGAVIDVSELFLYAKEKGAVTLLDASQTMGFIPFKASDVQADIVAFTGHKSLLGPPGTGGLYIAEGINLEQHLVGGTGIRSDLQYHPEDMPLRFEAGTPCIPAFAGLAAALRWKKKNAGKFSGECALRLISLLEHKLKKISGIRLISPGEPRTAVLSLTCDKVPVEDLCLILEESFGIVTRSGLHCAPIIHKYIGSHPNGTLRLSLSPFNTEDEVEYATEAIRKVVSM